MSSKYTQADIAAIVAALQEQKVDEKLASNTGVESKNEDGPQTRSTFQKPTPVASTATGPTPAPKESDPKDLEAAAGISRPREGLKSFDILQLATRVAFSKDKEQEVSTFLPSAHRLYAIQHELDSLNIQNRYFRQAIPSFLPTHSRVYIGILFIVQVFRAMDHAGILAFREKQFLAAFLASHPAETLPIFGPILPVLQSLCVSNPQDGTMPRVTPSLPAQLGPAQAQNLFQGPHNFAIPNIPLLFGLHEYLETYVRAQANPDANTLLTQMGVDAASTAVITLNGAVFPVGFAAPLAANAAWTVASPGLSEELEVSNDILSSFKSNHRFARLPVLAANNAIRDFGEYTRVFQGSWFTTLKRNMSIYARFVKGSGTLQDVSVEGPTAGQIIALAATAGIQAQPTGFFQAASRLPGDAAYSTTQVANDRIGELHSVFTQIHQRILNHPNGQFNHIGEDATANGRQGTFWDIRPIQPQTLTDHVKDSLGAELSLYVRERADRD
jgi:hypothetical protein